jgi:hypothetical protein
MPSSTTTILAIFNNFAFLQSSYKAEKCPFPLKILLFFLQKMFFLKMNPS